MPEPVKQLRAWFSDHPAFMVCLVASLVMGVAYLLVFELTIGGALHRNAISAICNALPLGVIAYLVIMLLRQQVFSWPGWLQFVFHLAFLPVFALAWYTGVIILLGWSLGSLTEGFAVRPFTGVAFTWQMFQGMMLYGGVAATAYALAYREIAARMAEAPPAQATEAGAKRIMVRVNDEWRAVSIADIVLISGAGDYAEVNTGSASYLSRKTLTELASLLPEHRFVRVHRSHIVNLDAILAAEPAGNGCLTLQMTGGASVKTSRSGARRVKALSI